MAEGESVFFFGEDMLHLQPGDYVAKISGPITDPKELFDALARALKFPDYFGENWNALLECLDDLSWIEVRRVALVHDCLPALDSHELSTYLEVLAECVHRWRADGARQLCVVFPSENRETILNWERCFLSEHGPDEGV